MQTAAFLTRKSCLDVEAGGRVWQDGHQVLDLAAAGVGVLGRVARHGGHGLHDVVGLETKWQYQ